MHGQMAATTCGLPGRIINNYILTQFRIYFDVTTLFYLQFIDFVTTGSFEFAPVVRGCRSAQHSCGFHEAQGYNAIRYCIKGALAFVCFSFFFWLRVLDKAEYSAFESKLNSSMLSYRIV